MLRCAKPYSDREGERTSLSFRHRSSSTETPLLKQLQNRHFLLVHMDEDGLRFLVRKLVQEPEQNVATSNRCS